MSELKTYEVAKRTREVRQLVLKTRYGTFRMMVSSTNQEEEVTENLTKDFWLGPWLQEVPVEIRRKLHRKRWLDLGANTGWFAFKIAHKLSPKVVSTYETSKAAFSYLRHNHMSNDPVSIISTHFGTPVMKRGENTHVGEVTTDKNGYMNLKGKVKTEVPVETFEYLVKCHRYDAYRFNMNGMEKEFLLKGDLSKAKFVLAMINPKHYTDKEYARLKKKLKKLFPTYSRIENKETGKDLFICYTD